MKLLVLGNSSVFRRRVLPGLAAAGIAALDVCSESGVPLEGACPLPVTAYGGYSEALAHSDAEAVYVSTHNSRHAGLVLEALGQGRHVAVDKPAFQDPGQAFAALELADKRGLVLAEATVWTCHPRVAALRELFGGQGPSRLQAAFSFPPFAPGNYRMDKALGGGALLDLGPYAVSPGRFLFGCAPSSVSCRVLTTAPSPGGGPAVETSFACLLAYPGGRSFTGVFGFDTGYANSLLALGPGLAVSMDRAFTPAPGQQTFLELNGQAGASRACFPPADAFSLFFSRFAASIRARDGREAAEALRMDAQSMAALLRAARSDTDMTGA